MHIKEVIKKQAAEIKPSRKEIAELNDAVIKYKKKLESEIKKRKIKAEVFIGGSFAKKTILKKKKYDIDVFVRFGRKYKDEEISFLLGKAVGKARKIHGSRDYYQVNWKKINFEIIPVIKISKPEEARNTTDLSFSHVLYARKKLNQKLIDDILAAKLFCHARKCYGAESYIGGFSGYALELLVIHYKSFMNFIKAIAKSKGKIIIDMEKHYKSRQEILLNLNEAKLQSPIVLIDPTFKSRNVLAALSMETFLRFKEDCGKFLKKPSSKFFQQEKTSRKDYNLILKAETDKQEGDIAGSKLLKFHRLIKEKLEKYFFVLKDDFEYDEGKTAELYFKIKKRKELILHGPPASKAENFLNFKKKHKNVFVKNNRAYAKEKINFSAEKFILNLKKKEKNVMREMGITKLELA